MNYRIKLVVEKSEDEENYSPAELEQVVVHHPDNPLIDYPLTTDSNGETSYVVCAQPVHIQTNFAPGTSKEK